VAAVVAVAEVAAAVAVVVAAAAVVAVAVPAACHGVRAACANRTSFRTHCLTKGIMAGLDDIDPAASYPDRPSLPAPGAHPAFILTRS
jgi:hypothetical protein